MLRLRPYKNCDAKIIAGWITGEQEFYQWSSGKMGNYPLTEDTLRAFHDEVENSDSVYQMVAFDDSGIVGYITMQFTDENRRNMCFEYGLIDPQKRVSGLGKKLLRISLRYVFDFLNVSRVTLGAFENNEPAYKCYSSVGFKEVDVEECVVNGMTWNKRIMEIYPETNLEEDHNYTELKMINEIIDTNSFDYAFQPIVEAATGEIYGYEALMRADFDGPVAPGDVLKGASKGQRLYDIEKATFFNVMATVAELLPQFEGRKLFINSLPGYQLNDADYSELREKYSEVLKQSIIEVTEEKELEDEALEVLLRRSAEDGFGVAIDDYGTGYSNTSSLLRYLPNCVKMDRLLISRIHEEPKKQHFVRSIVTFAHENGFLALAEGVETLAELRCVIRLGADLIQGFYTGRPSLEIVKEIHKTIRNDILNANVKRQLFATRKMYTVTEEKELPLLRLALEKYTGILVSQPELTIVGNPDYIAAMSIKIKEGCSCKLTIRNVYMESVMDLPCIEIGKNAHLTLVLEGENLLNKLGICVPEGSSVRLEGGGNLRIRAQGVQGYGIGNLWDAVVGDIAWAGSGLLDILVEADEGIGIGGGSFQAGEGISICAGTVKVEPASERAIAIGCVNDGIPIEITKCAVLLEVKADKGVGIGSMEGGENIKISSSKVEVVGSGSFLCGIGSNKESAGTININSSSVNVRMNGQQITMMGSRGGALNILMANSNVNLKGEGSEVLGLGTEDEQATIRGINVDCSVNIRSGNYHILGAKDNQIFFKGGVQNMHANA